MKSVTIKDKLGNFLIKILHRKDGMIVMTREGLAIDYDIEIRDDENCKVIFEEIERIKKRR